MHLRGVLVALVLAGTAGAGAQQSVRLEFRDGHVSLDAQNAPVRLILAEWARLGGATIINGDRVAGPPVTLELQNVPERQALDVVLRSVAGYMLAPRPPGAAGASAFDRILILPTSVAPRNPPPAPAPVRAAVPRAPIVRPPVDPDVPPVEPGAPVEFDASAIEDGPPPQPGMVAPRGAQPPPFVVRPPVELDETPDAQDPGVEGGEPASEPPTSTPTPANPFGITVGSSSRPGVVIAPAPQPQRGAPNRAAPNRVE